MGVIKQKLSFLAPSKVGSKLFDSFGDAMIENGLSEAQAKKVCDKVAYLAYEEMGKQYTVMGGYSPEDQLFTKAQNLMVQLDESEELEKLVEPDSSEPDSSEPSESDLEDAYNAADSIEFAGSPKQIKWARDIATNSNRAIALAGLSFKQLPTSAKWWIDNRNDIYGALRGLK